MKDKNFRRKFQKFIVGFAVVFFIVIGVLTWLSGNIDALLYPTVTAATTSNGSIDPEQDTYSYKKTIVPTSSIKDGVLWYVAKDSNGDYYVHTTPVTIVRQTAMKTEIEPLDIVVMPICDSNKELEEGDRVLVKAGVL
jgi:hypothetical protein